jgi:hypothetical protein
MFLDDTDASNLMPTWLGACVVVGFLVALAGLGMLAYASSLGYGIDDSYYDHVGNEITFNGIEILFLCIVIGVGISLIQEIKSRKIQNQKK